jgi:hypothetical protein
MPETAEIDCLVFELDDRGDLREPVDPFDERYSMTSPKRRAKSSNCWEANFWPRKKITR